MKKKISTANASVTVAKSDTKAHAKFGSPSTLSRHRACPGNIAYTKDMPVPPESEYALEGTVFHDFMERCLPYFIDDDMPLYESELDKCKDLDMADLVEETCLKMQEKWNKFREKHAGCKYHTELQVFLSDDCFGTADVVFVGKNIKTQKTDVVVFDYKHGKGVIVAAEGNLQITAYLIGAIKNLKLSYEDVGLAVGIIAQVRLEKDWDQYVLKGSELKEKEEEITEIVDNVKNIYLKNSATLTIEHLQAGSHCRFCKADGICVAQKEHNREIITQGAEEHDIENRVKTLTLDEQVAIFLQKSQVEDFLDAVARNLKQAFETGVTHPALKLIQTKGRRGWIEGKEEKLVSFLKRNGCKKPYKQTLIGIGDAEKALGKDRKAKLAKFIELSKGKKELVRADDKRQAIGVSEPAEQVE